ncbi:MAG: hypothetical protein KAY32_13010 [Candidatus Eisenbacteria sp.]|nr:hypothetical protein [Candidatus Eisenbacteria bacterium]
MSPGITLSLGLNPADGEKATVALISRTGNIFRLDWLTYAAVTIGITIK